MTFKELKSNLNKIGYDCVRVPSNPAPELSFNYSFHEAHVMVVTDTRYVIARIPDLDDNRVAYYNFKLAEPVDSLLREYINTPFYKRFSNGD